MAIKVNFTRSTIINFLGISFPLALMQMDFAKTIPWFAIFTAFIVVLSLYFIIVPAFYKIQNQQTWIFVIFLVKLLILFLFYYMIWLPSDKGDPAGPGTGFDALRYDLYGWRLAENNFSNAAFSEMPFNEIGIVIYAAFFYKLFGHYAIIPSLFTTFISVLLALETYILAKRFFNHKVAFISLMLTLLLPELIVYSSLLMKDVIVAFLFIKGFRHSLEFIIDKKSKKIIPMVVSLLFLLSLRFMLSMFLLGLFVIYFIMCGTKKIKLVFNVLTVMAVFILAFYLIPSPLLKDPTKLFNLEYLYKQYRVLPHNFQVSDKMSNSFTILTIPETVPGFIILAPVRTMFLYVSPFPFWRIRGAIDWLQNPSTAFIVFALPLLLFGIYYAIKDSKTTFKYLFIPFVLGSMAMANIVLIISERYRIPMVPFALIFISYGLTRLSRIILIYVAYPLVLLMGIYIYYFVKSSF